MSAPYTGIWMRYAPAVFPLSPMPDRAIAKLKRYSNTEQLEHMKRHENGIETLHSISTPLEHMLGELELSTANGHTLQMEYRKGNGETTSSRSIDPYGLVLWKGQWYAVAYCHERQEIRSFRVDRITGLLRTETSFVRPADFSARDFLLQNLLPSHNKKENLVTVVIAASEGILNDLCSHWLFGYTLEQRMDGRARFLLDEISLFTYAHKTQL